MLSLRSRLGHLKLETRAGVRRPYDFRYTDTDTDALGPSDMCI